MLFNLASIAALLTIFPCILAAPIDEAARAPDFPRSLKSRSLSSRQGPMAFATGRISVSDGNGNRLGYLASFSQGGVVTDSFTDNADDAFLVSFSTDFIGGGENGYGFSQVYFHVSSNNSLPNGFEYLAAVESFASDGGGDLATSSSKFAYLTVSGSTITQGPAVPAQAHENAFNDYFNVNSPQENSIWSCSDYRLAPLSVVWVDEAGNNVPTAVVGFQGFIVFTGDASALISAGGGTEYFLGFEYEGTNMDG